MITGRAVLKEIDRHRAASPGDYHLPVASHGGEPLGSVMIFDDLTQRKQLEAERARQTNSMLLNDLSAGWPMK